ncbi:MAG: tyrosine-protein phosphatase [Chloroflexi bacterium]|nr:tyrosine-protein phosphatase [Chloroflexota bacterium]
MAEVAATGGGLEEGHSLVTQRAASHQVGNRHIPLEGCFNFRDIGGIPTLDGRHVRRQLLYRSDSVHHLTGSDAQRLAPLGIRTILDLRGKKEAKTQGLGPMGDNGARHIHVPLMPSNKDPLQIGEASDCIDLGTFYYRMLARCGPSIRTVMTTLADRSSYATVIQCVLGKDRTGIATAVVLRSLGVPDRSIIEDYALSGDLVAPLTETMLAEPAYKRLDDQLSGALMTSPSQAMETFLQRLDDQYGSVYGYLATIGVGLDTLDDVRRCLLE